MLLQSYPLIGACDDETGWSAQTCIAGALSEAFASSPMSLYLQYNSAAAAAMNRTTSSDERYATAFDGTTLRHCALQAARVDTTIRDCYALALDVGMHGVAAALLECRASERCEPNDAHRLALSVAEACRHNDNDDEDDEDNGDDDDDSKQGSSSSAACGDACRIGAFEMAARLALENGTWLAHLSQNCLTLHSRSLRQACLDGTRCLFSIFVAPFHAGQ